MGKTDISSSEKLEIEILASEETEAFTGKYFTFFKNNVNFLYFFNYLSEIHFHNKKRKHNFVIYFYFVSLIDFKHKFK